MISQESYKSSVIWPLGVKGTAILWKISLTVYLAIVLIRIYISSVVVFISFQFVRITKVEGVCIPKLVDGQLACEYFQ